MHQQARPGAVGAVGTGPRGAAGLSSLGAVSVVDDVLRDNFDVYFRASAGLNNLGTMSGVTVSLDGTAADMGDYFDIPSDTSGVTVTGYSGSLTYPASSGAFIDANSACAVIAVDLSDITTPGASQRLFGHKTSTASTPAGFQVDSNAGDFEPRLEVSDGTTALLTDSNLEIAGEGRRVIIVEITWPFANVGALKVYDTAGTELSSTNVSVASLNDFTVGTSTMSFFAGHDGTDSADGVSGTRTLKGIGGAFTRDFVLNAPTRIAIAQAFAA